MVVSCFCSLFQQSKPDSGIIVDLSNTLEDTPSDPFPGHEHANVFPTYREELLSPPSCTISPQDFNSGTDSSFFSFSSTNLTSLAISTDQSDSSSSHHNHICPPSDQYPSTELGREGFFTPHTSFETPEHSDISERTTKRERYDSRRYIRKWEELVVPTQHKLTYQLEYSRVASSHCHISWTVRCTLHVLWLVSELCTQCSCLVGACCPTILMLARGDAYEAYVYFQEWAYCPVCICMVKAHSHWKKKTALLFLQVFGC